MNIDPETGWQVLGTKPFLYPPFFFLGTIRLDAPLQVSAHPHHPRGLQVCVSDGASPVSQHGVAPAHRATLAAASETIGGDGASTELLRLGKRPLSLPRAAGEGR